MTPTTPSPISDQAAGEREAFEAWVNERYLHPEEVLRNITSYAWDAWQARAALSTAPTTGSAPVGKYLSEAEMFDAHMDGKAGRVIWFGIPAPGYIYAAPASPAASVLTDEQIMAIYYAQVACVEKHPSRTLIRDFGRALLAAPMGGEKA